VTARRRREWVGRLRVRGARRGGRRCGLCGEPVARPHAAPQDVCDNRVFTFHGGCFVNWSTIFMRDPRRLRRETGI